MQALKESTRGIEGALHDISVSLRQYQGADGLTYLMQRGKLSVLEALGEFKKSNDEIYDSRMKSVAHTRSAMLRISTSLEMISGTIATLFSQIDELFLALECFAEACDRHTEPGNERSHEEREFNIMQCANSSMNALSQGLVESINVSCCGLQSAQIKLLEEQYADIKCKVGRARTEFDVHRRKVQVSEAALVKARKKNSGSGPEILMVERELEVSVQTLHEKGNEYQKAVENGMKETSFVLEQASMITWSVSNVLFAQLSSFFQDTIKCFDLIAGALVSIKNNRAVSKRINLEKQSALMALLGSPEDTTNTNTSLNDELVDKFSTWSETIATISPRGREDMTKQNLREATSIDSFFE